MFSRVGAACVRFALAGWLAIALPWPTRADDGAKVFRAGAAVVDISPTNYPVIVNAMFEERSATNAWDPLRVRCLVLDDGTERIAIAVVDTCMMTRDLIDEAKRMASKATGIRVDRMLVSATHTHSAPAAMGCLGSRVDPRYARFLPGRIADGIARAAGRLQPARVGWGSVDDYEHTHNRRWIRRPDKLLDDPFGDRNVRANMHPGYRNPDAIGPSGPVDPGLSMLSVQTPDGKPIALLANYSMHYYESPLLSADYYGLFATKIAKLIGAEGGNEPFVGIMSQGTSGDQMWMDYGSAPHQIGVDAYAQEVAETAMEAYGNIRHQSWVPLAMAESKLTLGFRLPDEKRLAWARERADKIGDAPPRGMANIYAKEAIYLHERPTAELVLQAIRIGDLGITAIPNEVYAITGLKLKLQSPFPLTFNVELANGAEGYIPPPEQHRLGGYTTWPARTAGLETNAEPRIVEACLRLLEQVSGKPRHESPRANGAYAKAILESQPLSYWRLEELAGTAARDDSGHDAGGRYEGNLAFYLDGPRSPAFSEALTNRAVHLAGGHVASAAPAPAGAYTVEFWFWNGLPTDARAVTGSLFSMGSARDRLLLGGTNGFPGQLVFATGGSDATPLAGKSAVKTKTWNHLALTRRGKQVTVYLNGTLEISGESEPGPAEPPASWRVGAGHDATPGFEGKVDEIAWFGAALGADVVARHFAVSGIERPVPIQPAVPEPHGAFPRALLDLKPLAYWRMGENGAQGRIAADATGRGINGVYEEAVEPYDLGPQGAAFSGAATNHAPLFGAGRLKAMVRGLGPAYSVAFCFRNEAANDGRPVTGYLFSRGPDRAEGAPGDHLGIGGTHDHHEGRLFFFNGNALNEVLTGDTVIEPRSWNHVVLAREGKRVAVYLNGNRRPEITGDAGVDPAAAVEQVFLGGRNDNFAAFQGYIDEVAVFGRPLSADEVAAVFAASGLPAKPVAAPRTPPRMSAPPKTPAESKALLRVADGFDVELVAAEPLVASPVAIDWGTDGRLWVVEMADYPYGMDGKMKPGGRVRILEDTDGDGKFDKSTVFLDGLNFPNGIITWRKGAIVTAAPDILYVEDTDGDGKADKREVLFTGFREGNLQLRVNGLRWGLDNWLHCANGWSGGQPRSTKTGATINIDGRDLRLKPDEGLIEVESGQSEFGRNRNDRGDWFGCDNSYPLFHFVLEDRYMRRNAHVAAPDAKRQLYLPSNPRVYPLTTEQKRYHTFEHASHFTSACSTDFNRDARFFPRGTGDHAFVCEPVHNLVQHLRVDDAGASFTARRAEPDDASDFLASRDPWFRPVMARTGPDGALWVVDMYRYMIEHPDWLPPEGKRELEPFYRAGEERGRIYRVTPKRGAGAASILPRLDRLGPDALVATLDGPNGWQRDKAQQLLLWHGDKTSVPALERLVRSGTTDLGRLQALCTLDGLGGLGAAVVIDALRDPSPAVRRHAVRLAEPLAASSPVLLEAAIGLADDPDAKVRLQLACSLGEWKSPRAGDALARIAVAYVRDRILVAAVISSAPRHLEPLLDAVAGRAGLESLEEPLLTLCLAVDRRDLVARLLAPTLAPAGRDFTPAQFVAFNRFLDTLSRRNASLEKLGEISGDPLSHVLAGTRGLYAAARRQAIDGTRPTADRVAAVSLLGRDKPVRTEDLQRLAALLGPNQPGEVQRAAVHAAAATGDAGVPALLLGGWTGHLPETRSAILDELVGREPWAMELLDRIGHGGIDAREIGVSRVDRLLKHASGPVKSRAKSLFAGSSNPDRQRVIDGYRPSLATTGDAQKGHAVFARVCAACHQLDGVGREIGPNLISVRAHPPEKLLTSILDPSREVEPRYLAYACSLVGGEELYGLVSGETGNGIEMKLADGTIRTVLRADIKSLQSAKLSLMPDGLEAGLTQPDMADLIQYLRGNP